MIRKPRKGKRKEAPMRTINILKAIKKKSMALALGSKQYLFFMKTVICLMFVCAPSTLKASSISSPKISKGASTHLFKVGSFVPHVELETMAWNGSDSELAHIERSIMYQVQRTGGSPYLYYLLSHIYARQFTSQQSSYLAKSLQLADHAINLDPNQEYGYLAKADILDILGDSQKAIDLLDDYVTQSKTAESWRILFARARLSADKLPVKRTLKLMKRSLMASHAKQEIIIPYIITAVQTGYNLEEANKQLVALNKAMPSILFQQMIAINLTDIQDFEKADDYYKMMSKSHPNHIESRINHGVFTYITLNNYPRAIEIFNKQLETVNNDSYRTLIFAHLGAVKLKQKKMTEAEDLFIKSIKIASNPQSNIQYIINLYKESKDYIELVQFISRVNNNLPGSAELFALSGLINSEHLKRYEKAISDFKKAILLESHRPDLYLSLGLAFYHTDQYLSALDSFEKALVLNPNDSTSLYNKACVLALLGQHSDAILYLSQAIGINPKLQDAAINDSDFRDLKSFPEFNDIVNNRELSKVLFIDSSRLD